MMRWLAHTLLVSIICGCRYGDVFIVAKQEYQMEFAKLVKEYYEVLEKAHPCCGRSAAIILPIVSACLPAGNRHPTASVHDRACNRRLHGAHNLARSAPQAGESRLNTQRAR